MNFREVLTAISQEAPSDEIAKQCVVQYLGLGTLQVIKTVVENHKTFVAPTGASDGTMAHSMMCLVGTIKSDNKGKMLISPRALCSMFGYVPLPMPWKPNTPPTVACMFQDGSIIIVEHPNTKGVSPMWRRANSIQESKEIAYSWCESKLPKQTPTIR